MQKDIKLQKNKKRQYFKNKILKKLNLNNIEKNKKK